MVLDVVFFYEMWNGGWVIEGQRVSAAVDGAVYEEFDALVEGLVDQGFALGFFRGAADCCLCMFVSTNDLVGLGVSRYVGYREARYLHTIYTPDRGFC